MHNSDPEYVYHEVSRRGLWPQLYFRIREETRYSDLSAQDSRKAENRHKNRYRDVYPYDHTRIRLQRNDLDYINANWVEVPEAERAYILTQGPLPHTASHFWLMVWEQECRAVVMLNNVIEKGFVKCHQYFPVGVESDEDELCFDDVDLKISYVNEDRRQNFVIRTLELSDMRTGESRKILQFHYSAWPDFGVPESPRAFLDLLLAVRASGALSKDVGPVVVHCSAGIGRSGTFCLVDSALVLAEKYRDLQKVDVLTLMMKTRRYRMGLIQSQDQLRFMFEAILEGAHSILNMNVDYQHFVKDKPREDGDDGFSVSQLIPKNVEFDHPAMLRQNAVPASNHKLENWIQGSGTSFEAGKETPNDAKSPVSESESAKEAAELRKRNREERIQNTQAMIDKMKAKQKEREDKEKSFNKWKPYYIVGVSIVVVFGAYLCHRFFA